MFIMTTQLLIGAILDTDPPSTNNDASSLTDVDAQPPAGSDDQSPADNDAQSPADSDDQPPADNNIQPSGNDDHFTKLTTSEKHKKVREEADQRYKKNAERMQLKYMKGKRKKVQA